MPIPLRVLLLEDSALDAELLLHELREAGFVPEWRRVDTEAEFLRCLREPFDVILADYNLPQFDGLRAVRHLQRLELDVPLILVTGSFEDVALECVREGAADYLIKDRLARLGPAVTRALEQRRLRREKLLADHTLREREERFRALVQHGSDIVTVLRPDGRIVYVSPSIERVLGLSATALLDTDFLATVHKEDASRVQSALAASLAQPGDVTTLEYRQRHSDGSWRLVEAVATNLTHLTGVQGVVLNARDITERKRLEDQLSRRALYDVLTGLPNRALFADRLTQALAAEQPGTVAVLLLDLDDFRRVNESLGHAFGDELLAAVAQRLTALCGPGDTVARMGGDEFAILPAHPGRISTVTRLAQRVLDALAQPFVLHERKILAPASIGVALAGVRGAAAGDLLRDADVALYQAKASGRACFRLFDEAMHRPALARLGLEAELRHAIERDELRIYYQPIVDLRRDEACGAEALVRWQHPRLGLLTPEQFLPMAEETGLILQIDEWVLGEVCRQAKEWRALGLVACEASFSVNLSVRDLQQPDLTERVASLLAGTHMSADALCLEITEGSLMQDVDAAVWSLSKLRALGVKLAIDDFGTGYSSLSYIQRFPIDALKIDRSFVAEIGKKPATEAIVEAVIALARALDCGTTAEGIETRAQREFLRRIGCDQGQGYLFSPPVPATALPEWLAAQKVRA